MDYINAMMEKFAVKHQDHLRVYGDDNASRLTGQHETSSMNSFSFGIGNRAASIRIPTGTAHANGKGYIEDRRPASNIDPYLVSGIIYDTAVLTESHAEPLKDAYEAWREWRRNEHIPMVDVCTSPTKLSRRGSL